MAAVGSSKINRLLLLYMPLAIAILCHCPPEQGQLFCSDKSAQYNFYGNAPAQPAAMDVIMQ